MAKVTDSRAEGGAVGGSQPVLGIERIEEFILKSCVPSNLLLPGNTQAEKQRAKKCILFYPRSCHL